MRGWALCGLLVVALCGPAWAESCDYYASPDGSGSGFFKESPFKIQSFWSVAKPGSTLCLTDGVYQGAASMIDPGNGTAGLSGTSDRPITVKALNDGGVTIDGQFGRRPINLNNNDWWQIEGVNAKSGTDCVICVDGGSDNNTFRRIVAWDIWASANGGVVSVHRSINNLFEDVAAFGMGRKTFTNSQGGNRVTCRRCWFRWEGSIFAGPLAVTLAYNSRGAMFENVLVNWNGLSMPETYISASTGATIANFQPDRAASILTVDRIDGVPPKMSDVRISASIVYVKPEDQLPLSAGGQNFPLFHIAGLSETTVQDLLAVISPSHPAFNKHLGMSLTRRPQNCESVSIRCEDPVVSNRANRITSIRGANTYGRQTGDAFGTIDVGGRANEEDWIVTGASTGTSPEAVQSPWQNTSTNGARLCYQTVGSFVTTTPLWPWPMNDRIKAATASAGAYSGPCRMCVGGRRPRVATDVTADMEMLLGAIPEQCKRM